MRVNLAGTGVVTTAGATAVGAAAQTEARAAARRVKVVDFIFGLDGLRIAVCVCVCVR